MVHLYDYLLSLSKVREKGVDRETNTFLNYLLEFIRKSKQIS